MRQHVVILGVINIAFSALGLLLALIVFVAVTGGGLISQDPEAMKITAIVGTSVAAFLTLVALPGFIAGIGLLKFKPWARILVMILAVFNLMNVPIGTLLGVYSFWVLLNEETIALFDGRPVK